MKAYTLERIRMGKNLYRAIHVLAIHSFVHLEVTCKTTHVVLTPPSLTHQASRLMEEGASNFTDNTELNNLRIVICLRKSEITVERISVCNVIEKLMENGIHCLPCSHTNEVVDLYP